MHQDNDEDLVLSGFLNLDVTKAQHRLFNPTFKNVLTGFIMYDVNGEGAKKKLARRRLDLIKGNIAIYSRCLNSSKRMEEMKYHHELAATVADISTDQAKGKGNSQDGDIQKIQGKGRQEEEGHF